MFSRKRSPAILPRLPRTAQRPPKGAGWIHEVKHDGFRIIARRDAKGVRLFTRNGYDFTARFPKIVDAVASLSVRSCVVDGEAIVVDERGLSVFDDLRWVPLEDRKQTLGDLIRGIDDGIAFNQHFDGDGEIIFRHACSLGCEGIVSKRLGSPISGCALRALQQRQHFGLLRLTATGLGRPLRTLISFLSESDRTGRPSR